MSDPQRDISDLARRAARTIEAGFDDARQRFNAITLRAKTHFESRDWHAMMADMGERLELHSVEVNRVIARLRGMLGDLADSPRLWKTAKDLFAESIDGGMNRELAETFFNSVTRRILSIVGKNTEMEFDSEAALIDPRREDPPVFDRHDGRGDTAALIEGILESCDFRAPFEDLRRDAERVGRRVDAYLEEILGSSRIDAVETVRAVFYRQKLAYVIGRIRIRNHLLPLVLPLRHGENGIAVDAVLMSQGEVSVVFSFTRSHFHVDVPCPRDLVVFLKGIMPLKPIAELYISLGFHKHGKTELYRNLRDHMANTVDRFDFARGDVGMVMIVFTLPFYNVVFKVIRDRFAYPKSTTRRDVMNAYRLVFTRDRVGRLVEAQEFEHLEFRVDQFGPELLEELQREAGTTVRVRDGAVVIEHVYVERKVTPLNVYLREATEQEALEAILDYGEAVKELAAANIFPGDFLLKNFGVTRQGRVVFYDYDELCLMTDCHFRPLPPPRTPEDELSDEPWFAVADNDVFPEQFGRFLGLAGRLRDAFERHHGELFTAEYWRGLQDRLAAGEILDVFPYPRGKRLRR